MLSDSKAEDKNEKSYTPAIIYLLVIGSMVFLFFVYLISSKNTYSGEIIGIISFIATLFAIFFAYEASQKTWSKLDTLLSWGSSKTDNDSSLLDLDLSKKERKNTINRNILLAKTIEEILIKYQIPYASEFKSILPNTYMRPDFVICLENKRVPLEIKSYPKRFALPVSRSRIEKIKNQMNKYMDSINSRESILIIWNPEITDRAKELLSGIDNRNIYLINDNNLEKIKEKFIDLLVAYNL